MHLIVLFCHYSRQECAKCRTYYIQTLRVSIVAWADPKGEGGPGPLENHMWLKVSLEILARTPSRSNWTIWVQLLLEGASFDPRWNTLMNKQLIGIKKKKRCQDLPDRFFRSVHECCYRCRDLHNMKRWLDFVNLMRLCVFNERSLPRSNECPLSYTRRFVLILDSYFRNHKGEQKWFSI